MIPENKVKELIEEHVKLEDHMTGAIWIRQNANEPEAWIVEVIPGMVDDECANEAVHFNPGLGFRFPLALIAGNKNSIEKAIARDKEFAKEIANGKILHDEGDASHLVEIARTFLKAA